MFASGVTMGLAEWIIDDTCLVKCIFLKYFVTKEKSSCKIFQN